LGLHVGNRGKLGRRVEVAPAGGLWRATRPLHPGLRPFVRDHAGYWEAVTARRRVRMIPTPRAVVLISLGEPFGQICRMGAPGPGSGVIGSLVGGLSDGPTLCEHPGGQEAIRLELTPLGAYRLLALPTGELTNQVVELRDVLGPGAGALADRLAASPDWAARFDLLDAVLLARLERGPVPAPEVGHAWRLPAGRAGAIPIARVAAEVGWSQKHLVRRFTQQVGLTPKMSARVLRFHRAVGMLTPGAVSLADVSAACGFYDQSHLSCEFSALAGITPGLMTPARRVEGPLALWSEGKFLQAKPSPAARR
jgi:AraC-like DNA-binding protein